MARRRRAVRIFGCAAAVAVAGGVLALWMSSIPDRPPVHFWIRDDDAALRAYDAPGGNPIDGWTARPDPFMVKIEAALRRDRASTTRARPAGDLMFDSSNISSVRLWLERVGVGSLRIRSWKANRWDPDSRVVGDGTRGWSEYVASPNSLSDAVPDPALAGTWRWDATGSSRFVTSGEEWTLAADGSFTGKAVAGRVGMRWGRVGDVVLLDVGKDPDEPPPRWTGAATCVVVLRDAIRSFVVVLAPDRKSWRGEHGRTARRVR